MNAFLNPARTGRSLVGLAGVGLVLAVIHLQTPSCRAAAAVETWAVVVPIPGADATNALYTGNRAPLLRSQGLRARISQVLRSLPAAGQVLPTKEPK
jgi:hypothetical protein